MTSRVGEDCWPCGKMERMTENLRVPIGAQEILQHQHNSSYNIQWPSGKMEKMTENPDERIPVLQAGIDVVAQLLFSYF